MSRSISVSLALVVSISLSFVVSVALCSAGCSDPPQQRSPRDRDAGRDALPAPLDAGPDASAQPLDAGGDASPWPIDAGPDALPPPSDAAVDVMERRDAGLGAEMFAIRPRGTQLTLQAGSSLTWTIDVVRADAFETPIVLEVFGLPAGVRAAPIVARPGDASVELVLAADASAPARDEAAFSLQASADGWMRRARITVSVTR